MEILTFPNCRQSIWLAVFFILWTVIVQVICIISGVPSYLCATILYVSTVTILAIAFRTKAMDRSILRFDKPNIKVLLLAAGGTLCLPWVHALIYSIVPFPEFLKKIFTEIGTKDSNEAYIYPFISAILMPFIIEGEFYQFNLSSCIRQQNSLTAQFVSFSLANLANIFYPPDFYNN